MRTLSCRYRGRPRGRTMRFPVASFIAVAALTVVLAGSTSPAEAGAKPAYYLSLGDSAAAGLQPLGMFHEIRGYADQLYDLVRPKFHELRLVKLGCSGETTESLISG